MQPRNGCEKLSLEDEQEVANERGEGWEGVREIYVMKSRNCMFKETKKENRGVYPKTRATLSGLEGNCYNKEENEISYSADLKHKVYETSMRFIGFHRKVENKTYNQIISDRSQGPIYDKVWIEDPTPCNFIPKNNEQELDRSCQSFSSEESLFDF